MTEFDEIALAEVKRQLTDLAGVQVIGEWQLLPKSAVWTLRLCLELLEAEPTATVPHFTEWEVVVDFRQDVWGKVQLHPALSERGLTTTFNHQQFNGGKHAEWPCRAGYICTVPWSSTVAKSRNAVDEEPDTTIQRLYWHVTRALQWLQAAAKDELVAPGHTFELPDFATSNHVGGTLIYQEDAASFTLWQQQKCASGIADVSSIFTQEDTGLGIGAYVINQFYEVDGRKTQPLYKPEWGLGLLAVIQRREQAFWIRLPQMPVVKGWQAPNTMAELREALATQGYDFDALLAPLWKAYQLPADALLLIGAPIPNKMGEAPARYHWQALQLVPPNGPSSDKVRLTMLQTRLKAPHALRWVSKAENWHPDQLQNRGRLVPQLRESRILLLGAGALGSAMAEQLVRMGVQNLTVVDGQRLEGGNLVRHTLALPQLYYYKAPQLASHLNAANPLAKAEGLPLTLPTTDERFDKAVAEAMLIIDATGENSVLRLLPLTGTNPDALFVSCSLSLFAKQLFFYAERANEFRKLDFDAWYAQYGREQELLANSIELPRGAGCWNPLTPAPLNRINGLAGVAVDLLEQLCSKSVALPVTLSFEWSAPTLAPANEDEIL